MLVSGLVLILSFLSLPVAIRNQLRNSTSSDHTKVTKGVTEICNYQYGAHGTTEGRNLAQIWSTLTSIKYFWGKRVDLGTWKLSNLSTQMARRAKKTIFICKKVASDPSEVTEKLWSLIYPKNHTKIAQSNHL